MTGLSLKIRRVGAEVTVGELAKAMGYPGHARVSQIEKQKTVSDQMAARYLEALAQLVGRKA